MTAILDVCNLSMNFGGLRALNDVSLQIKQGQIVALIGPNGAGKTTFFNCLTGIYKPTEGEIYFSTLMTPNSRKSAERILLNNKQPHTIARLGISRTFQNIRLFGKMSVLENVMVGRHIRTNTGIWGAITANASARKEEQESIDKSYEILKELGLHELWNETANNLSYGAQRRLEIARALATEPKLVLLDEPAAGMNPQETKELEELVQDIRKKWQLSILLIEHDMNMVMSLSDCIYVMEYGSCIASGTPEQIKNNPDVIKAYLGEENA